jgi:hypothetical protein
VAQLVAVTQRLPRHVAFGHQLPAARRPEKHGDDPNKGLGDAKSGCPCAQAIALLLGINPLWEGQALGLAQSGIETICAEGAPADQAVECDPAQYGREFEGECLEWPGKSSERLGLEPVDVDFDKSRFAMTFDQLVQDDCRSDEPAGPALTTPSRRRRRRCNKA